jgi:pyruvate dehydrogenase E1 component
MVEQQRDVFYYVTVMNENYAQPSVPAGDLQAVRDGILKGIYPLPTGSTAVARVQLLGAGAILGEVIAAQTMLKDDWGIDAAVWSVTSFTELQRDGMAAERSSRLGGVETQPYVSSALGASQGPVIAATDYVRAVPELIRAYVPRRYVTLGTDGFGRSDTRAALREFFEVDRASIAIAALKALADEGEVEARVVRDAVERYGKSGWPDGAAWVR